MVFSSAIFLFGFMPILFILYYLSKDKYKNFILLIFSLIFYGFGGPKLLVLMCIVVFINYLLALLINKKMKYKKVLLSLTILMDISILFYFKYSGFTITIINRLFDIGIPIPNIILPIGISFYIFQTLSYVIDVYKKDVPAEKNPLNVLLYVSMFPQLVAGPIVRYKTVADEIKKRTIIFQDIYDGLQRFIFGLAKKLVIANNMGRLSDDIFSLEILTTPLGWLGAIAYTLQIYFDFSAYSDMAIGLGKMLGFNFNENFNYPYISKSITEFWRRWHISLSTWFRDYIYIPLGGNRKGIKRHIFNLFVVWSLTGIWHGASINFLLWGLYYFIFLIFEKFILKRVIDKIPNFILHIYSILVIIIGWIIFRNENLYELANVIKVMFIPYINSVSSIQFFNYISCYWFYLLIAIILSYPIFPKIKSTIFNGKLKDNIFVYCIYNIFVFCLFIICIIYLSASTYNPFIYFRF